jgi:hypothetical protein
LIVKGTPDKNRAYPMWPKDLFITGPVMDSHDKWVENKMAPENPVEPVVVQSTAGNE